MKYAIQIVKEGEHFGKYWGHGTDGGPWVDSTNACVISFQTREDAEFYAGSHLKDGTVQIIHIAEAPPLRDYTSAERNEIPIWDVLANYFPDAIASVARHSKKANDKHNPGEPLHWSRHKSSDHLNKAARHLMTPDAVDPDTNEIELAGAAWRCLAALQLREEKRLIALGIRPLSGVVE